MKFFRMDSDLADWKAWENLRDKLGSDFHAGVTVYLFMYSMLAKEYRDADQKTFSIPLRMLARRCFISVKKVEKTLTPVGIELGFSWEKVGKEIKIFYPNFLRKQKLHKRDGDGKFC